MENKWLAVSLEDLGTLRVHGTDATRFLQGQLSNDLSKLSPNRSQLAGYHNPQGRVIAVLRLVQIAPDDVLAILPRDLASTVVARLSKYVLRAKVKIADESSQWRITGLAQNADAPARSDNAENSEIAATVPLNPAAAPAAPLPATVSDQADFGSGVAVRIADEPARWLILTRADSSAQGSIEPSWHTGDREAWRQFDISSGLPQVYASTSEEFVAQMLNLDVLDAIAFDKGCYTGQEVIARAHYRGRVKRRLQRFITRASATSESQSDAHVQHPVTGGTIQLSDGRALKVVESTRLADGRWEFLAVTGITADAQAGPAGGARADGVAAEGTATGAPGAAPIDAQAASIDVDALPLPYALPD